MDHGELRREEDRLEGAVLCVEREQAVLLGVRVAEHNDHLTAAERDGVIALTFTLIGPRLEEVRGGDPRDLLGRDRDAEAVRDDGLIEGLDGRLPEELTRLNRHPQDAVTLTAGPHHYGARSPLNPITDRRREAAPVADLARRAPLELTAAAVDSAQLPRDHIIGPHPPSRGVVPVH